MKELFDLHKEHEIKTRRADSTDVIKHSTRRLTLENPLFDERQLESERLVSQDDSEQAYLKPGEVSIEKIREKMEEPVVEYKGIVKNREQPEEIRPVKLLSFSRAGTIISRKDNSTMQTIKTELKNYMDYADLMRDESYYEMSIDERSFALENAIAALEKVERACVKYNASPWYLFFRKNKNIDLNVESVRKKTAERLTNLRKEYLKLLESDNGAAVRKKREKDKDKSLFNIGGQAGAIVFDENREELSETSMKRSKKILQLRAKVDQGNPAYSPDFNSLISKIGKYASITDTATSFSSKITSVKGFLSFGWAFADRRIKNERKLVSEIKKELERLKESVKAEKERKELGKYSEYFNKLTNGTLEVPPEGEIVDLAKEDIQYEHTHIDKKRILETIGPKKTWRSTISVTDRKDEPLFAHEPCLSDVSQKSIGNCYFLAALSSMAANDPTAIKDMMKEDEDHNVTVRFYKKDEYSGEYSPVYIKVDKKVYDDTNWGTLWVAVICKAFSAFATRYLSDADMGCANRVKEIEKLHPEKKISDKIIDFGVIANGGTVKGVIPFLKGRDERLVYSKDSKDLNMTAKVHKYVREVYKSKNKYTKDPLENDYAVINGRTGVMNKEIDNEKELLYFKSVYDEPLKKMEDGIMAEHEELARIMKEKKKLEGELGDDGFYDLRSALRKVMEVLNGMFSPGKKKRYSAFESPFELMVRQMMGDDTLSDSEKEIAGSVKKAYEDMYEKFRDPEFWKEHGGIRQERLDMIKRFSPDEFLINEKESCKGYIIRRKYGQYSKDVAEWSKEERKDIFRNRLIQKTEECLSMMTSAAEKDYPKGYKRFDIKKANVETFSLLYGMDLKKYEDHEKKVLKEGMNSPLKDLATMMGVSKEVAFLHVKNLARAMHDTAKKEYESPENADLNGIFTGEYTREAIETLYRIKIGLKKNKILEAGTRKDTDGEKTTKYAKTEGLIGRHAYSILGTKDAVFKGKRIHLIKLRNPWGWKGIDYVWDEKKKEMKTVNSKANDGIFYIELNHFLRAYDSSNVHS